MLLKSRKITSNLFITTYACCSFVAQTVSLCPLFVAQTVSLCPQNARPELDGTVTAIKNV